MMYVKVYTSEFKLTSCIHHIYIIQISFSSIHISIKHGILCIDFISQKIVSFILFLNLYVFIVIKEKEKSQKFHISYNTSDNLKTHHILRLDFISAYFNYFINFSIMFQLLCKIVKMAVAVGGMAVAIYLIP